MDQLIDKRVLELFQFFGRNGGNFFAVTSDINSLGLYIARNNRAKAENLVDLYNIILDSIVTEYQTTQDQIAERILFIPSGEETTILGVCGDIHKTDQWISQLADTIQARVRESGLIDPGNTRIVFGWTFLQAGELLQSIKDLAEGYDEANSGSSAQTYYAVMEQLREILARKIDANKFRHLTEGDDDRAVLYRNMSLAEYADHKVATEKLLRALRDRLGKNNLVIPKVLQEHYGVNDEKMDMIRNLKDNITK